jgi:hypothetical protein
MNVVIRFVLHFRNRFRVQIDDEAFRVLVDEEPIMHEMEKENKGK